MYGKLSAGTAGGGLTALPHTGVNALWLVVAAFTLVFAGLALLKFVPRKES